ncbi:aminotransferase-like domain-containing protein [Marinobacter confluentis]|uniref:PLP-dependent aminotransferase family protein n=1 Tax=Marinobacter confluentis TaxID=1697557 RepID=A0A4Z1BD32_9GAMM|nr:PLP-dependent aminotransferase family protein [Marinobacter confluentis]TGN40154.1 PLP-dependent aminotransferase family protein [Marinobacter confluentis]
METNLYAQLADSLSQQIREGLFRTGDKMPSVRHLARREAVSISTVTTAYSLLEQWGWVEARPKSGYFVARRQDDRLAMPRQVKMKPRPRAATTSELVMEVQRDSANQKGVSMSAAIPALDFPILGNVQRAFTRLSRTRKYLGVGYDAPEGLPEFRQQIARRAVDAGVHVSPDEIISTAGCQNAMALGLRVLTQPGDIIALESPCYYGLIQMAEAFGLKVIEIPAHHDTGISVEALKLALEKWPIKALVSVATFSNPLGSIIPDERKQELMELLEKYDVPMIEDDIYGELYFGDRRPKSVKAFDRDGRVLLCSSVSKTIDPQLRVGWIMPGRYLEKVTHQKFIQQVSGSTLPQMVTAEIMAQGAYDRHLRQARETYRMRSQQLVDLVSQHFPENTRLSRPKGGLVAWVELPDRVNTTELYHRGRSQNLTIAPGEIFSASGQYKCCFRINFAQGWSPERVAAVQTFGEWIRESL